ncbi:MAG: cupredoxin domain-containing protein [Xanthobacteraceae bacterium]
MTRASNSIGPLNRRQVLAVLLALPAPLLCRGAAAEDAVSLSLTIKDGKFEPAELHAPAGRALEIHVTNLNKIPSEFESGDLHVEKIVPVGKEAVVRVRPQQPGRYNFFDDFHRETQGMLVVQ